MNPYTIYGLLFSLILCNLILAIYFFKGLENIIDKLKEMEELNLKDSCKICDIWNLITFPKKYNKNK